MKKHLLLLITAMLFNMASVFAQNCDYSGTAGTLNWCLKSGTLTISGNGEMPDYGFDTPWWEYREDINIVVIETGVVTIGNCAFIFCTALTSITLPSSVTTIGDGAFMYCYALNSVTLENGVTTIGNNAFHMCSLASITLPSTITTITADAFSFCTALTSIDVASENANYSSTDGVLFDKGKSALICYPAGKIADTYVIPNSVTTIGDYAFCCCAFTSIVIPNSVIIISGDAFTNCYFLASITLGINVTTIGSWAFNGCFALTSITIPSSVTTIGSAAFRSCTALTSVTNLNTEPVEISSYVFEGVDINVCTLKVPVNSVTAYQNANVWQEFNIVGIYSVNVSVNNEEYGTAIGDGYYEVNETATVTSTANDGYKFVNWTKSDVEISVDNPYSFTVTEDVELVANFEKEVGMENIEIAKVKIYPNPTTGKLKIESGELRIENVVVYDVFGKILKTENWKMESTIDISHLPVGVYFVKISTETGEVTRKVMKE